MSIECVVLVDDDELVLRALGRNLRGVGKRVFATADAVEAREMARTHHPELAIVDILLGPNNATSGIELLEQLRRDASVVFVLAQSAVAIANTWTEAYEAGANLVVEKGRYELADLLARVERGTPLPLAPAPRFATPARASWEYVHEVVRACGGVRPAARALGMDRTALQRKLKRRPSE
jgi:two-component system, response regulator RegA